MKMEDVFRAILCLIGLCFTVGCSAAAFAIGWAVVGRWLEWAPINMTVNIHNHYDDQ